MKYDNLNDARGKLNGTFAYYKNRAVYIKGVDMPYNEDGSPGTQMVARIMYLGESSSKSFTIKLDDPEFQYMRYNLGYLNYPGYAIWYYRVPVKQYKQGLHRNQCNLRDRSKVANVANYDDMGLTKHTAAMLENRYISFEEAASRVAEGSSHKSAFHKDFAVYMDKLRKDFVIEYKGYPAAFGNASTFQFTDDMKWLREAMQELNIKVA